MLPVASPSSAPDTDAGRGVGRFCSRLEDRCRHFPGSPSKLRQSEALRPLILSSAKRVPNKMTVRAAAGGKKLAYTTPFGNSTTPFKPVRGC